MGTFKSEAKRPTAETHSPRIHLAPVDALIQGRRRKPKPGIRATVTIPNGADGPLVLSKQKAGRDFSTFVSHFGREFVTTAVEFVRAKRAEMNEKTWWMNVDGLEDVLAVLAVLSPEKALQDNKLCLSEDCATSIEREYLAEIEAADDISEASKLKRTVRANVVLSYLAQAGLVNRRLSLDTGASNERARFGKAKQPDSLTAKPPSPRNVPPSNLNFVAHGVAHDYAKFKELGEHFMTEVANDRYEFSRSSGEEVSNQAKQTFQHFLGFIRIRKRAKANPEFYAQLAGENFRLISERDWSLELGLWREHVVRESEKQGLNPGTPHNHIRRLTRALGKLSSKGILPAVTLKGVKGAKSQLNQTPRKNLAQVSRKREEAVVALADDMRRQLLDLEDGEDVEGYIRALCDSLPAEAVANMTISEITKAIEKLNRERLLALRACAEAEFIKWHEHWQTGQLAMRAPGVLSGEAILSRMDSERRLASEVRKSSRALFEGTPERSLGNLMNYAWADVGGIATGRLGRWHHLQRKVGGRIIFQAYLHAHSFATTALWVMLLVDSAANTEVCRETPWNCLKPKGTGKVILTLGIKERARVRNKGKQISIVLDEAPTRGERISTVQAIRAHQEMFSRHRQLAPISTQDFLLLTVPQSRVKLLTEYNAREWFRQLAAGNPVFHGLPIVPSMVRPSKLLDAHLSKNLAQAQAQGDHSSAVTTLVHYSGRLPVNTGYSLLMRKFTNHYEAIAASSIERAASKLQVDPVVFEQRLREARALGLGELSLAPQDSDAVLDERRAGTFAMTTRYVVATDEIISELIEIHERLTYEHSHVAEPVREAWESKWMPWLVFSEVALSKLSTGETAPDFLRVQEARRSSPTFAA